jgi:hypothetical protein
MYLIARLNMKKLSKIRKNIALIAISALLAPSLFTPLFARPAHAANLAETMIRLDRMTASAANVNILVCAKTPSGETNTESSVRIVFDINSTSFGVNSTASNITTSTAGITSLNIQGQTPTAWPSIGGTASAVSGQQVDFNSGAMTANTLYCFYITSGITTPSSTGGYVGSITTRDGSDLDTAQFATRIISNDQVVVTATVPPTFTFSLDQNTLAFGVLDSGAVNTTGDPVVVTIGTNASNGWITWLRSANAALNSATTGESIATAGSVGGACTQVVAGSDFYQLRAVAGQGSVGTGTATATTPYGCSAGYGGTFSTAYQPIGTGDGTTDADTLTLYGVASMTAIKAAATDYTDILTIVGAANF